MTHLDSLLTPEENPPSLNLCHVNSKSFLAMHYIKNQVLIALIKMLWMKIEWKWSWKKNYAWYHGMKILRDLFWITKWKTVTDNSLASKAVSQLKKFTLTICLFPHSFNFMWYGMISNFTLAITFDWLIWSKCHLFVQVTFSKCKF